MLPRRSSRRWRHRSIYQRSIRRSFRTTKLSSLWTVTRPAPAEVVAEFGRTSSGATSIQHILRFSNGRRRRENSDRSAIVAANFCSAGNNLEDSRSARRDSCAYLATTTKGKSVYLAKELVEADFVLPVGATSYDALLGYRGTNSVLYPRTGRISKRSARPSGRDTSNSHLEMNVHCGSSWTRLPG